MREIKVQEITAAVSKLCKDSCYYLPEELLEKLKASIATEESPLGQEILTTIVEKADIAKEKDVLKGDGRLWLRRADEQKPRGGGCVRIPV